MRQNMPKTDAFVLISLSFVSPLPFRDTCLSIFGINNAGKIETLILNAIPKEDKCPCSEKNKKATVLLGNRTNATRSGLTRSIPADKTQLN